MHTPHPLQDDKSIDIPQDTSFSTGCSSREYSVALTSE